MPTIFEDHVGSFCAGLAMPGRDQPSVREDHPDVEQFIVFLQAVDCVIWGPISCVGRVNRLRIGWHVPLSSGLVSWAQISDVPFLLVILHGSSCVVLVLACGLGRNLLQAGGPQV